MVSRVVTFRVVGEKSLHAAALRTMGCKVGMKACTRKLLKAVVKWSVIFFMRVDDDLECILWPLCLLCQSALQLVQVEECLGVAVIVMGLVSIWPWCSVSYSYDESVIYVVLAALVTCGCVTSS